MNTSKASKFIRKTLEKHNEMFFYDLNAYNFMHDLLNHLIQKFLKITNVEKLSKKFEKYGFVSLKSPKFPDETHFEISDFKVFKNSDIEIDDKYKELLCKFISHIFYKVCNYFTHERITKYDICLSIKNDEMLEKLFQKIMQVYENRKLLKFSCRTSFTAKRLQKIQEKIEAKDSKIKCKYNKSQEFLVIRRGFEFMLGNLEKSSESFMENFSPENYEEKYVQKTMEEVFGKVVEFSEKDTSVIIILGKQMNREIDGKKFIFSHSDIILLSENARKNGILTKEKDEEKDAYFVFCQKVMKQLATKKPKLSSDKIMKECMKQWKARKIHTNIPFEKLDDVERYLAHDKNYLIYYIIDYLYTVKDANVKEIRKNVLATPYGKEHHDEFEESFIRAASYGVIHEQKPDLKKKIYENTNVYRLDKNIAKDIREQLNEK